MKAETEQQQQIEKVLLEIGWTFYFQGQDIVWCERYGVRRGKTWKLERNFGSR